MWIPDKNIPACRQAGRRMRTRNQKVNCKNFFIAGGYYE